ncbi:hypothetical protein PR202_gb16239 [Eleusine coracana subsp. coracana]|uniref:Protein kinase domain-containing protein n=1 Tax=Eleusine coracana subsp. coracana TaxID=191504 RepID=A0AAV5F139_ELECO|nr:hypothetical protein PR202_gb16239 [Eleusine coracana subsp. coracana]
MASDAGARSHLERMLHDESVEAINLPISLLASITNDFSKEQQIGEGGFATVYMGILSTGSVAVKKLFNAFSMDDDKFTKEVSCLMRVKHKNVVRFLGYCADAQGKMLDYEGQKVIADERQRGYMAPESFDGVITFKSDIYSLGIIIIEMLTGQKRNDEIDNVSILFQEKG